MKFLRILIVACLIALMAVPSTARDTIHIKFAHSGVPDSSATSVFASLFSNMVSIHFNGNFKVDEFPDSQLGSERSLFEQLQSGSLQMAAVSYRVAAFYSKAFKLFESPFAFNDREQVDRFQASDAGRELLGFLAKNGVVGLGYLNSGMMQIASQRPLRKPQDISGLRIDLMGRDDQGLFASFFRSKNGAVAQVDSRDVKKEMTAGIIDAAEISVPFMNFDPKAVEAPSITLTNHSVDGVVIIASQPFWNTLSAQHRQDLLSLANQSLSQARSFINTKSNAQSNFGGTGGLSIQAMSGPDRSQWVKDMQPVWKKELGDDLYKVLARVSGTNLQCAQGTCACAGTNTCSANCCQSK